MTKVLELPVMGRLPNITRVQVQTHSRCNADCLFCPYVESEHAANPGVMPDKLWARVLECLAPFRAGLEKGKFCPYLMQEPLIDKTIFAKIRDIYAHFDTLVEVSTNGAALTDRVVDQLIEVFAGRRHELWVSHHGIDAASFEHLMKIDYQKAHANLLNLLRRSDGRLRIRIRGAGVQRNNGPHVFFTREQYRAYWAKTLDEHAINRTGVDVDATSFHDRAGTLLRADRGANTLNVGKVRDLGPGHEAFHCPRVDDWIHVMYDGRIRLCCMDYHGEVQLPSLKDMTLIEYFQSAAYRELVEKVSGRVESASNFICKRCTSPGG
ncbi:Radical SAM domain protein [Minicystis rosea]|nr:Radical SAM domain protein [Minicystis rosea]